MPHWQRLLLCLILLVPAPALAADKPAEQWIVVTAPAYRAAVEPLCEQRKTQEMTVRVVQTSDVLSEAEILSGDARKLRAEVNRLCRAHKGTSYVFLVGAIEAGEGRSRLPEAAKKVVPTLSGTVSRMKRQPSDNGYGCLGEGVQPTVAVGRLPARSVEEARAMIKKTLDYERDRRPGPWRRRVTILAGAPMFNPAVDDLIERAAMGRLAQLDPSWEGHVIYNNPGSRFCVPVDKLHDQALKYLEEGQAVTLYLGHSDETGFATLKGRYLDRADWEKLKIARGPGIFVSFGCFGCQLRGAGGEGYGVVAIRNPHGPAAVIGSHNECFAAMCNLASDAFVENFLTRQQPRRLGETWLHLKAGLAKGSINPLTFRVLDAFDGNSKIPEATQRLEHLEMFVLLGDPALQLPSLPINLKLTASGPAEAGQTVTIEGTAPANLEGAKVILTVERPLPSEPLGLETITENTPAREADEARSKNHELSNKVILHTLETTVKDGHFTARLAFRELPPKLPWNKFIVRAYAATEKQEGMGVQSLEIKPGKEGKRVVVETVLESKR